MTTPRTRRSFTAERTTNVPFGRSSKPRSPLDPTALLDYAVKALGSRMKSERDLRRRLAERAEEPAHVDAVIAKLKALNYLSDERFAADFTRLRRDNEKHGQRRVQQGLMQKGIPQPIAQKALIEGYEDIDEVALARDYIARKRLKRPEGDREEKQKQTAKIMRRLLTAGFTSKTIWKVLREWDASIEEVDVPEDDI